MKKILFKTIKNSNIEILYETNRIYTIKDIKKVIENQYGWDHKKLKIYKDKYDINSLLNDDEPLDQYLRNSNKNNTYYYLKNYKYIPISIYEEKKIDDSMNDFDFDSFCSRESSSNSIPQVSSSNKELHKNINNFFKEKSKNINSENPDSNRKSVTFTNKNNIFGDNNINDKNSNVNKSNIPKPNNNDDNSNSKNKNNIKDNKPNINNTNTENKNINKKNESKNETNNNQNNFQKQKSEIIQSQSEKPQKKNIRRPATEEIFTEAENQKIEELINFVGCTREKGIKALKITKWDVNEASNIIFEI